MDEVINFQTHSNEMAKVLTDLSGPSSTTKSALSQS